MKRLGSITKHYPFLESETIEILNSIMNQSAHYLDFSTRLCEYACENDVDDTVVYLGALHSSGTLNLTHLEKLCNAHPNSVLPKPRFLEFQLTVGKEKDWNLYLDAIERVLSTSPADWIVIDMERMRFDYSHSQVPTHMTQEGALKRIEGLMEENNELSVFQALVHRMRGSQYYGEGSIDVALIEFKKSVSLSLSHDDLSTAAGVILNIALAIRNFDTEEAINWWKKAFELYQKLGLEEGGWGIWNIRGTIYSTRGEFDTSEESYLKAIQLMNKMHSQYPLRAIPGNLMFAYNEMRKYEEALEWAQADLDTYVATEPIPKSGFRLLQSARALIGMGRSREAAEHLELGHRLILETGRDRWLSDYHLVSGLLDKATGKPLEALESYKLSFKIAETNNQENRVNSSLLRLAELQLEMYDPDTGDFILENDKDWISYVEQRARKRNYPGILGQALVLRAKYHLKQSSDKAAKKALEEAVAISKNFGAKYIQGQFSDIVEIIL